MFCPQCGTEYREHFFECSDCHVSLVDRPPELETPSDASADAKSDVLIQTGIFNLIAIGLAETLLREAGIPYFVTDQNTAARQESGNVLGWWSVRVPREREDEAREILRSVEEAK
jgi:Putative prokaryotic signal transducing protein